MANELPYFRFTVQAWQNGDISLESYELKGLFIDVCGYYWIKDCSITLAMLEKKFRNDNGIQTLLDLDIIKHENRYDKVEIVFLDKQYDLLSEKRKRRQAAGSKGGNAKAMLKQKGSYKDKDKENDNNKDKDKNLPKKEFSATKEFKILFEAYYLNLKKEAYYWTAKDAGKCKPLSNKLLFKIKEKSSAKKENWDEDIKQGFEYLLSIITDDWILNNLSMAIIDSKFNEIIANNGKPKPNTDNRKAEVADFLQRSGKVLRGDQQQ